MTQGSTARRWHLATAVVAVVALGLQLGLVVAGVGPLLPAQQPGLPTRLVRFVSYFTILSNLLVLVSSAALVRGVAAGGGPVRRGWRVLRLDAVACIAVTGIVHWFLLRPLLHLHGASYAADKLLHVVVPLLAVVGWVAFGPRRQVTRTDLLPALAFPVGWLVYTLVHGALGGWYPYPFLDVDRLGYPTVLISCLGVAALLLALSATAVPLDRWLSRRASAGTTPRRPTGRT